MLKLYTLNNSQVKEYLHGQSSPSKALIGKADDKTIEICYKKWYEKSVCSYLNI